MTRTWTTSTRAAVGGRPESAPNLSLPGRARNPVHPNVQAAIDFLKEIVENQGGIRVEELEETGEGWSITLSYLAPADGPLAEMQRLSPRRLYKRFHVVGGVVRSMKIRETEDA